MIEPPDGARVGGLLRRRREQRGTRVQAERATVRCSRVTWSTRLVDARRRSLVRHRLWPTLGTTTHQLTTRQTATRQQRDKPRLCALVGCRCATGLACRGGAARRKGAIGISMRCPPQSRVQMSSIHGLRVVGAWWHSCRCRRAPRQSLACRTSSSTVPSKCGRWVANTAVQTNLHHRYRGPGAGPGTGTGTGSGTGTDRSGISLYSTRDSFL